jgi:hypothetical protein
MLPANYFWGLLHKIYRLLYVVGCGERGDKTELSARKRVRFTPKFWLFIPFFLLINPQTYNFE